MNDIAPKYRHKEAFALMWYACPCGHRERIWNSRDGVTPFGTRCPSCGEHSLTHLEWRLDKCTPDHKLVRGQKFWRDGTPAEAEAIMKRRIELQGIPKEIAARLLKEAGEGGFMSDFPKGWPALEIYREDNPV